MTLYTLQFLRFLASFLVLLFHLNLVRSGYKGVDVFFVISGFVMYYTLFCKSRPRALKFIVNRCTKIFFLYWVALGTLFIVKPFKVNMNFLGSLLLVPGHYSVLGVSWSLSYELYFYFLIGTVVYMLANKHHKLIYFLLFFISTLITFINLGSFTLKGSVVNFFLGANFWEFLLGIGCALLATTYYKLIEPSVAIFAAILSVLILLAVSIPYDTPVSYVVYGILSFLVVFFSTAYETRQIVNQNFATSSKVLGEASYAMYLFGPVITIVIGVEGNLSKIIIIVTTFACSIIISQLIENNILKWGRRLLLKETTKPNTIAKEIV